MKKQNFIIQQLEPYFKDKNKCAYDNKNGCQYKTTDNKRCVFGKNLKRYNKKYEGEKAEDLLNRYGETILKPEVRGILTSFEWNRMQQVHDSLARGLNVIDYIKSLEKDANVDLTVLKNIYFKFRA